MYVSKYRSTWISSRAKGERYFDPVVYPLEIKNSAPIWGRAKQSSKKSILPKLARRWKIDSVLFLPQFPPTLRRYGEKTYRALTGLHKLRSTSRKFIALSLSSPRFFLSFPSPVFIDKLDFNRAWFHLTGRKSPTERRFFSPHEFSRKTTSSHVASHSG